MAQETKEEKAIPDITPEQEAVWDGPQPGCIGYDDNCQCKRCLTREAEEEEDEDDD